MTPAEFQVAAFTLAITAGVLGSLLGLGGGIIVVPALTIVLGVDIRYAIGASIVSVIATSSGSALRYVKEELVNLRLAMFLEIATVSGALSGAYLAGVVAQRFLYFVFTGIAVVIGILMVRQRHDELPPPVHGDTIGRRLALGGVLKTGDAPPIPYEVTRTPLGLFMSYLAGTVSGLLGVGGGFLKVPAMNVAMRVPLKVSTATSNFMIGVTAAASAGVFFLRGDVAPCVAAPVATGVIVGALIGSWLIHHISTRHLRYVFILVLAWIAVSMALKGLAQ